MQESSLLNDTVRLLFNLQREKDTFYFTIGNFLCKVTDTGNDKTYHRITIYDGAGNIIFDKSGLLNIEFNKDVSNNKLNSRQYAVLMFNDGQYVLAYDNNGKLNVKNVKVDRVLNTEEQWITFYLYEPEKMFVVFNVETEKFFVLKDTEDYEMYGKEKYFHGNFFVFLRRTKTNEIFAEIYDKNCKKVKVLEISKHFGSKIKYLCGGKILCIKSKNGNYYLTKAGGIIEPRSDTIRVFFETVNLFKNNDIEDVNHLSLIYCKKTDKLTLNIEDSKFNKINKKEICVDVLVKQYDKKSKKNIRNYNDESVPKLMLRKDFVNFIENNIYAITYDEKDTVLVVNGLGIFNKNGEMIYALNGDDYKAYPMIDRKCILLLKPKNINKIGTNEEIINDDYKYDLFLFDLNKNEEIKVGEAPDVLAPEFKTIYFEKMEISFDGSLRISEDFKNSPIYTEFRELIKNKYGLFIFHAYDVVQLANIYNFLGVSKYLKDKNTNALLESDYTDIDRKSNFLSIRLILCQVNIHNPALDNYGSWLSLENSKQIINEVINNAKKFNAEKSVIVFNALKNATYITGDIILFNRYYSLIPEIVVYCDYKNDKYYCIYTDKLYDSNNKEGIISVRVENDFLILEERKARLLTSRNLSRPWTLPPINLSTFKIVIPEKKGKPYFKVKEDELDFKKLLEQKQKAKNVNDLEI